MARPFGKRLGFAAIKLVAAALVLWGVSRHVARSWNELQQRGESLPIAPGWLIVSGLLYLAGLLACGIYYRAVLRSVPAEVGRYPALRAYVVSHLAKYVPGKAMVVVVRSGLVMPFGARGVSSAVATFYETLVMMAAGGLIAAVGFLASGDFGSRVELPVPDRWRFGLVTSIPVDSLCVAASLFLGGSLVFVVSPPMFGRLSRLATRPFGGATAAELPRVSWRLLGLGLAETGASWILLGASQLAVVRAVAPLPVDEALRLFPLAIGSVSLAMVAGFVVAVLPAGLGVREGMLMATLGPAIGDGVAVASALLLRLVWVAVELLAAALLVPLRPRIGAAADVVATTTAIASDSGDMADAPDPASAEAGAESRAESP
jgi:hypothetical protein